MVPAFLDQALRGEAADGLRRRLADPQLLLRLATWSKAWSGCAGRRSAYPVNLGNPAELEVVAFARHIQRMTATASAIVFEPLPEDDPQRRRPDITKAKRLLGWEPLVNLDEGLKSTIEHFRGLTG